MSVKQNILQVRENIAEAVKRRPAENFPPLAEIKLIAVTKNQPAAKVMEALDAGIDTVGENRVQEAKEKFLQIGKTFSRHLIGHLQTNKAKQAVELFDLIHSVDSERLAVSLNTAAAKIGKQQDVLMQVNVGEEDSKQGVSPILKDVRELAFLISKLENLKLRGLMTVAPFYEDAEKVRPVFKELKNLFTELSLMDIPNADLKLLSMGMTHDYIIAIEEGANLVRIGTGIFGERQY
ncbi:MAG: YggS family pyridoxal phosphate-dependent enzyme [Sporomusaceae bacterium]|jgi:pyridoxal phosphate enzyme (YggS family)|nr:YggS family pyridoxal phosphate-dependent enzyme [Sporomusaceae bacterium]